MNTVGNHEQKELFYFYKSINLRDVSELDRSIPIVVLDTNVLLDIIFNRNKKVKQVYEKCFMSLYNKGIIEIATTVYNVAELIDKILEINFLDILLRRKVSPDIILRRVRSRNDLSKEIANLESKHRDKLDNKLKEVINVLDNKLRYVVLDSISDENTIEILSVLILQGHLQSQDALIVSTLSKLRENSEWVAFITKDDFLVKSKYVNDYN